MKTEFKLTLIALLLIGVILSIQTLTTLPAQNEETIRIGYQTHAHHFIWFLAQEQKLFEKEGFKVELIPMTSANEITTALASGNIDAAFVNSFVLIPLEAKSPGLMKIARMSYMSAEFPQSFILVNVNSSITNARELKGKKIGLHPGSASKLAIRFLLQANDVQMKDVSLVEIKPELQLQTLQLNQVDALLALEPVATTSMLKQIGRPIINEAYSYILDPLPLAGPVVSSKFIKDKPRTVTKLLKIIDETIELSEKNPQLTRKVIANYTNLPLGAVNRMALPRYWPKGKEDLNQMQKLADVLYENKVMQSKINASNMIIA